MKTLFVYIVGPFSQHCCYLHNSNVNQEIEYCKTRKANEFAWKMRFKENLKTLSSGFYFANEILFAIDPICLCAKVNSAFYFIVARPPSITIISVFHRNWNSTGLAANAWEATLM